MKFLKIKKTSSESDFLINNSRFWGVNFTLESRLYEDIYNFLFNDNEYFEYSLLEAWPRLVLPQNFYIKVLVTSADVLHSWAVPSLGIKTDACPGRINEIGFRCYRQGVFYGQCSEICGIFHGYMPITLEVVSLKLFWFNLGDLFFFNNVN